jgi:hypothetical protein
MTDQLSATLVRVSTERGAFAVRDLSATTVRLVGQLGVFEGERVQLILELATPLQVSVDVVHVDRQRKVVEVAFRELTDDARAQIEGSITALIERVSTSTPTVLIAHPTVDVSSALERDLARVGVSSRICTTLQDATTQLADPSEHLIGVIVAGSFGDAVGPMLQHVEGTRADLRRVILFGDHIEKIEHPATGRVDAVLRTPWRFKGLARALGLPAEDVVTTYDQLVALQVPAKPKR